MTTEEVQQPQPIQEKIDVDFTDYFNKISEEGVNNYKADIELIVRSEKVDDEGTIYEYKKLDRGDTREFKKLVKESTGIDQNEDWDKYADNICKRACVLIKDMTPEKFDKGVFATLEKIVTGWSIRTNQGFQRTLKGA